MAGKGEKLITGGGARDRKRLNESLRIVKKDLKRHLVY